jgi:hypothetical protein
MCKELPGGQLIAVYKELPLNSSYESKYNFSATACLILSNMQFIVLGLGVSVFWYSNAPRLY